MKHRPLFLIIVSSLIFLSVEAAFAQEPLPAKSSPWKVEDVINQEVAGSFKISPDGKFVVWVKAIPHKEKDARVRHLYMTTLGDKLETVQLTRGDESSSSPRWSPSGSFIGLLTARKEKDDKEESSGPQIWILDRRGGEPWKLTSLSFGVASYDWIDDNRLILAGREDKTLREILQKEKKDTAYVAEDQEHMPPQRLFLLDRKENKLTRLTTNADEINEFVLSHDKKWVLTRNNQSVRYEVDKKIKPKFFLINLEDKSQTELFQDPAFKPNFAAWAADDKGFYFAVTRTSDTVHDGPGADFLYYYDIAGKTYAEVPLSWDRGLLMLGFEVREDGFITNMANGAKPKWRRYWKNGNAYSFKELEGTQAAGMFALALQEKGNVAVYSFSTASTPAQWYVARLEGNALKQEKPLTELNGHLKSKILAKTEVIKWKGALDEEIEGILYYPHNYEPAKRYPLFLSIHGGPTGVDMDVFDESWASYPNLVAQKGAFVLLPNYHGSVGYGQKFAESIKGHYYEYEIPDIIKGVDFLIAKGMVDPDKLGAMGWSNGGILTVALSVWTNRFKVAGVGAADVNWTSDYGTCSFGVSFDNYYFKGAPWNELQHYIEKSPLFHLKEMSVPTIIFHGTEDTNVPYGQGWEYFRALQQIGKAQVKFIVFPGQPHGLGKLTHQQRKMEEELAWFDRYFFKAGEATNEALKKGSPLDTALKMQNWARDGLIYGVRFKGALVPETVKSDGLEIGRFEVTRAQWSAFDKKYAYEKGTENYPATGISFEQAQQYVTWLGGLTGQKYRLPKAAEAEALAKKGGKSENNLDYWAGYALNYDDASRLLEKVKTLKGSAPLLCPVDQPAASTEELIYGLGGNAAEWAMDDKGKGKIVGGSAVTPAEAKGEYIPPLEYVGLRVVRDK